MKVPLVVDTNVVVSGLLSSAPEAPPVALLDAMLAGRVPFLLSADLLAEYRDVLLRPAIARAHGRDPADIDDLLTQLAFQCAYREVESSDLRGDAHLFSLLEVEARARLVSGDAAVLRRAGERGWTVRRCIDELRGSSR